MAARTTTKTAAKTDVAGRRVAKKGEPQFAKFTERNIPTRIEEFADWLERETGTTVDRRTLYLGSALRGTFQKSDENQKRIADRAAEIEREREARAAAREQRAAAKVEREAARAAKAAEPKTAPAPKSAAAKTTKTAAAKTAPAKSTAAKGANTAKTAATPTRRRPARPATAKGADADF